MTKLPVGMNVSEWLLVFLSGPVMSVQDKQLDYWKNNNYTSKKYNSFTEGDAKYILIMKKKMLYNVYHLKLSYKPNQNKL